jgi:serine/threonine protein kinase
MIDRQWREAWEIFRAARELADGDRRAFMAAARSDPEVLAEVESMLDESAGQSSFEQPSKTGSRFGRYDILGILGAGGMGQVYLAHDSELGRMVAVKFLAADIVASRSAVDRLIHEARAASVLNHPQIVTVYEVIRAGDEVAIAMELVEGNALRKFCGKPQELPRLIHWGRQIAQALAAAHHRGVVHRDIKPENLMVREDGILKVLDFGLALHAGFPDGGQGTDSSATLAGTLNYMSPEQTRAQLATSASDVFSLGVVLFELATGTHPFRADSPIDTGHAIAHAEPKRPSALNPSLPTALDALLLAMLNKDPGKRPSASEVDQRLSALTSSAAAKPQRRLRPVAVLVALALSASVIFWARNRIFPPKDLALIQLTTQVSQNRVTAAAVSPDGTSLAFGSFGGPVYLRRMSDGLARPLTTPTGLRVDRIAWLPDGSKLLLSGSQEGDGSTGDYQPGIWVMPVTGGQPERISEGRNGVPSPDGKRIALTSTDGSVVWVAGANGGAARQIRSGGQTSSFSSLIWSPDSKRVAYQRVDYAPTADPQRDPKGAQVYRSYQYSYESVDVETGRMAASAKDFVMTSACGLPDGRVLFLRWNSAGQSNAFQLWDLRTDPGTGRLLGPPRPLTRLKDDTLSNLSGSNDGKRIVAVRDLIGRPNIYVADLRAAGIPRLLNPRRLTFSEAEEFPHAWTPDSRTVIFESNRTGNSGDNYNLYRQTIDRSESEPLVVSPILKVMAQLSPDRKWVLYRESPDRVRWRIMRVPVQGGAPAPVLAGANTAGEFRCALQPGTRCVLRAMENGQIVFHELDPLHGEGRVLGRTSWSPTVIGDWDLSPDGSRVAIPNHDSRDARIRLVPLDPLRTGTAESTVVLKGLKDLNGVVWEAGGRGWYVSIRTATGGLLKYVDIQGVHVVNLRESAFPTYVVPSPDGRRIAFPEWTVSGNAWLFQGF